MDPPGILMLNSVRRVFELAGIEPESIKFQKDEYDQKNIIEALTKDPKKCPVITTADYTDFFNHVLMGFSPARSILPNDFHVMVTAGALKGSVFLPKNSTLGNEWFIKCKNSYADDPDQQGKIQYH